MSDEEKKAIEILSFYKENIREELYPTINIEEEKAIAIILNLIEKQQKEIEELKEKNTHITKEIVEFVNSHYISKDKIKRLRHKIHKELDINAITRGYQLIIDKYFKEALEE